MDKNVYHWIQSRNTYVSKVVEPDEWNESILCSHIADSARKWNKHYIQLSDWAKIHLPDGNTGNQILLLQPLSKKSQTK